MDFATQLFNGLQLGSIYALIALGYTMVYGIAKLINFAHGDIIMVGSYTIFLTVQISLFQVGLPLWVTIIPSIIACTILGVLIYKIAYKPLMNTSSTAILITAIGVSLFLENLFVKVFGASAKPIPSIFPQGNLEFAGISLSLATIITIILAIVLTILLDLFINKTQRGKSILAVSEDFGAAELVGINVDATMTLT